MRKIELPLLDDAVKYGDIKIHVEEIFKSHLKEFANAIKANVPYASTELIDDLLEEYGIKP